MPTAIDKLKALAKSKRIPYNYVIGGKETASPIPFDVSVSFDPGAKKTILLASGFIGLGLFALGVGMYSKRKRGSK